jgi:hypothetical protein
MRVKIAPVFAIASFVTACTTPQVNFSTQTSTSTNFNDPSVSFRIARSQISIAPKTATSTQTPPKNMLAVAPTVIDPVPTPGTDPIALPLNPGLFYTLSYIQPSPTGFTNKDFALLIQNGPLKAWPIPTCGTAMVQLFTTTKGMSYPDLTFAATPTEYDYPVTAGVASSTYSPLYRATAVDNFFSTTALKITYVPNTKLVSSVGTTVTDHVADVVTTVLSVATAVAPLAVAAAQVAGAPTYYAIGNPQAIIVGDNRVLDHMPLSSGGSITMNPTCGADSTNASTGATSAITSDAGKIITAAQALYKALQPAPAK